MSDIRKDTVIAMPPLAARRRTEMLANRMALLIGGLVAIGVGLATLLTH